MTRIRTSWRQRAWPWEAEWAAGRLSDGSQCREIHGCKAMELPTASRSPQARSEIEWPGHAKAYPRDAHKQECSSRLRSSTAVFINECADCLPVVNQLAFAPKPGLAQPKGVFLSPGPVPRSGAVTTISMGFRRDASQ